MGRGPARLVVQMGGEHSPAPLIRAARARGWQPAGGVSGREFGVEASPSSGFREQDPQEDVRRLSWENKTPK